MKPVRTLVLFWMCGILFAFAHTGTAWAQQPEDPLGPFLRGLADSTDVYFGPKAAVFDTTGIDSLIHLKATAPPDSLGRGGRRITRTFSPVFGFHRATGPVAGAALKLGFRRETFFGMEGSYGFADEEGRYDFNLTRTLWRPHGREGGNLDMRIDYARETVPFASEHATPFPSLVGAFCTGRDRQSVYERRGASAALTWSAEGTFASLGWRSARDQSMPRATRFTLWGDDSRVPSVTLAKPGAYREGFARLASTRHRAWPSLGLDGRYTSRSRWRVRTAAARSLVVSKFEAHFQAEGGMSARMGPSQDRFELGGPLAVPSLGFGDEAGNRMLLGKFELVHGIDLIRALHIPSIAFMSMHPAIFAQGGSAWIADDGSWNGPARDAWRGAAGFALIHIPGFPTPSTHVRLQMAWPIGRESGVARFSAAIGDWFDVIPDDRVP
jgi:hypothetical protein